MGLKLFATDNCLDKLEICKEYATNCFNIDQVFIFLAVAFLFGFAIAYLVRISKKNN